MVKNNKENNKKKANSRQESGKRIMIITIFY